MSCDNKKYYKANNTLFILWNIVYLRFKFRLRCDLKPKPFF